MIINHIEDSNISGIKIITPHIHKDDRGYFFESYNSEDFKTLGLPTKFVQDNQAFSKKGTLRGMNHRGCGCADGSKAPLDSRGGAGGIDLVNPPEVGRAIAERAQVITGEGLIALRCRW